MRYKCDDLIEHPNPFEMSLDEVTQKRFEAIKEVFTHHYNNNKLYNKYCRKHNITPDDIKSHEDLLYIPLLPSDFFKVLSTSGKKEDVVKIASVPESDILTYFTTSGTTGIPTRYPFDRDSIRRTIEGGIPIFRDVGEVKSTDYLLMLTPPPQQSDTGLVQGMYRCMKKLLPGDGQIDFAIKDGKLTPEYIIDTLLSSKHKPRHLYGPPFIYNEVADYMIKNSKEINLDETSKAFITGGWKRVKGEVNRRELNKGISKAFDILEENVRDGLGLTDIFSILVECSYHRKHVPPWMHVSIRNPKNLREEVDIGEEGLFAFLTSAITSYPSFIISGDIGVVTTSYKEKCKCGRIGPTVEHRRRATGMAARGCALVIEEVIKMMRR
jgi:long-chain-fatty-acid---luciferin-component ligase